MEIRVDPASVIAYGGRAEEQFSQVRSALEGMVEDAVTVRYYGPNAVDFKTACGTLGAEFAAAVSTDLANIAGAVEAACSAISDSLGGARVPVPFVGGAVPLPAIPAGDGSVGADPAALEALRGAIAARFTTVSDQLSAHLSALNSTDWTGNAKNQAVETVSAFTRNADAKVAEHRAKIDSFIVQQIDSLRAADHA